VPTSVRIEVCNPHSVVIGEVVIEVRDGKVHDTPSPVNRLGFVFHAGPQEGGNTSNVDS
jgi:hypothetical protein